jgi:hypothetical protein
MRKIAFITHTKMLGKSGKSVCESVAVRQDPFLRRLVFQEPDEDRHPAMLVIGADRQKRHGFGNRRKLQSCGRTWIEIAMSDG